MKGMGMMDITKVEMDLFCEKCNEDTVHVITYAGQKVIKAYCSKCHKEFHANKDAALAAYTDEVMHRIRTKPMRVKAELKSHPVKSVISLPARLITKLFRIEKEYKDIKKELE
ncbi:MAG: bh protein [Bacillota bacterium]